jgi:16S rRNA (cytidine1402-2'-O)-methyltransferase
LSEPRRPTGTLYLVPVPIAGDEAATRLPLATLDVVRRLDHYIAENPRSARRFLKGAGHSRPLQDIRIEVLDEHTPASRIDALLAPLHAEKDCGLISEAGCPAVADPGAALVRRAHETGVRVVPLAGPSSILLALMASGLNGQRFAFHGYLPADRVGRARALRELEVRAAGETQIFIETPYRNVALLDTVLDTCRGDTLLCIAADLTAPTQFIATRPITQWRGNVPNLDRRPAVFLLGR